MCACLLHVTLSHSTVPHSLLDYVTPRISRVRLINGYADWDGRFEIFTNNTWQTVCSKDFSKNDATIACNQLGWKGYKDIDFADMLFDDNFTDPIFQEDFQCSGDESSLGACPIAAVDQSACTHVNDTALRCLGECALFIFIPVLASPSVIFSVSNLLDQ